MNSESSMKPSICPKLGSTGRRFGLLMMDLDGLKSVNDRFGHFQGDQVLKAVSQVIRNGVRRIDVAARYGGDEFVVLLPETEPTGAYVLAEKIRQGVEELGSRGCCVAWRFPCIPSHSR